MPLVHEALPQLVAGIVVLCYVGLFFTYTIGFIEIGLALGAATATASVNLWLRPRLGLEVQPVHKALGFVAAVWVGTLVLFSMVHWEHSGTMSVAEKYYIAERPHFLSAAKQMTIHDYFVLDIPPTSPSRDPRGISWRDLITLRMKKWAELLTKSNIRTHEIEKDKCVCQRFLADAGVSHVPLYANWSEATWSREEFRNIIMTKEFPIIVKLGHIQGRATEIYKDRTKMLNNLDEVYSWIEESFPERYDDLPRSWREYANVLYNSLKPCVVIHPLLDPSWIGPAGIPTELKIEVLFGRVYLAYVETRAHSRPPWLFGLPQEGQAALVILRNRQVFRYSDWRRQDDWAPNLGGRPGTESHYPWTEMYQYLANIPQEQGGIGEYTEKYQWLLDGDVLDRTFHQAEKLAKSMGADAVRVDIFVHPNPEVDPIVNEISFSSGHYYRYHHRFMAQIWADGTRAATKISRGSLPLSLD